MPIRSKEQERRWIKQNPRQFGAVGGEPDDADRPGVVVAEKGVEVGQTGHMRRPHKQMAEGEKRPVEKQVHIAKRKRVPTLRQGSRELQEDINVFTANLLQLTKLVRSTLVPGAGTSAEHQWDRE